MLYLAIGMKLLCNRAMFNHLQNCQTFPKCLCTILQYYQQFMRISINSRLCQHFSVILILAVLVGMKDSLKFWLYISLLINDVELNYMCLVLTVHLHWRKVYLRLSSLICEMETAMMASLCHWECCNGKHYGNTQPEPHS